MLSDYYKILGVEPNADLITISEAFRQKAMNCHPDRGGSHAQMLLINEAWEVLSNSTSRARYDEARREGNSAAAQEAAAADARSARGRAGSYPRKWADLEKWLEKNGWTSQVQNTRFIKTHGGRDFGLMPERVYRATLLSPSAV
jgi:curved DNA-binding protein CbpA